MGNTSSINVVITSFLRVVMCLKAFQINHVCRVKQWMMKKIVIIRCSLKSSSIKRGNIYEDNHALQQQKRRRKWTKNVIAIWFERKHKKRARKRKKERNQKTNNHSNHKWIDKPGSKNNKKNRHFNSTLTHSKEWRHSIRFADFFFLLFSTSSIHRHPLSVVRECERDRECSVFWSWQHWATYCVCLNVIYSSEHIVRAVYSTSWSYIDSIGVVCFIFGRFSLYSLLLFPCK